MMPVRRRVHIDFNPEIARRSAFEATWTLLCSDLDFAATSGCSKMLDDTQYSNSSAGGTLQSSKRSFREHMEHHHQPTVATVTDIHVPAAKFR